MISIDDDTAEKIENFRHEMRYVTRSQATLELILIGLKTIEKEKTNSK